ncbi:MAG TPA: hypothetical protein VF476_13560, partial [Chitinophagaceae bacterium]
WNLSIYAGTGKSFFGGPGTVSQSKYHFSNLPSVPSKSEASYGNKTITNWQAGIQASRILADRWRVVLNMQYEHIGGSLKTDTIYRNGNAEKVDGQFRLFHEFISVNPQIAATIINKTVQVSVAGGVDYAFRVEQGDEVDYIDQNGGRFIFGGSGGVPGKNDLRITLGTQFTYKRFGILLNYKQGLLNVRDEEPGENVYTRTWHVSLVYNFLRLK